MDMERGDRLYIGDRMPKLAATLVYSRVMFKAMKKFYISRHAEQECQRRGIPDDYLNAVLQQPQQTIQDGDHTFIYQSQIQFDNGKIYLVRAVVSEQTKPAIVITVYRTSQISRYWRSE